MAEQNDQSVKKLSDVSSKLSTLNATTTAKLNNMESLTEILIEQNRSGLRASADVARREEETRKEASRAIKGKTAQDVNVLNWRPQEEKGGMLSGLMDLLKMKFMMGGFSIGDLFKKGGIKKLITTLGATLFKPIKSMLKFVKGAGKFLGKIFLPVTILLGLWKAVSGFMKGFASTEGNMFQKIMGGIGGAIKGLLDFFIFSIAEMVQDVIVWVGEFFGFDMSAVSDFDLVGKVKSAVFGAIDFVTELFTFKDTSLSGLFTSFLDIVMLPLNLAVNFVQDLFGWGDPNESFKVSTFVMETWEKVKTWFTGLWNWASEGIASGWTNLTDYVSGIWTSVKAWITGIFSWGKAAGATDEGGWSLMTFIYGPEGIVTKVKNWFKGIFAWGKEAGTTDEGGWSVMTFMYGPEGVVTKIKAWVGNLLSFKGVDGKDIGIVDKVIEMFKTMIENIVSSVKGVLSSVGGEATEARKYWDITDTGSKDVDTEALKKNVAGMGKEDLEKLRASFVKQAEDKSIFTGGLDNTKEVMNIIAARSAQFKEGGLVRGTGMAVLHGTPAAPEMVLDNQATSLFMQAAQSLSQLQTQNDAVKRTQSGSNAPIIVNQNNTNNASSQGFYIPPPPVIVQNQNSLPF